MKKNIFLCSIFFFYFFCAFSMDTDYYVQPYRNEYTDDTLILESFCKPIKFSPSGMHCFLRHVFSHKKYAELFLPHNFSHISDFLYFGKKNKQGDLFLQATLRLFNNKIKYCSYVSAHALQEFLQEFPELLVPFFEFEPVGLEREAQETVKSALYSLFTQKFSLFKENTDLFFDQLSLDMIEQVERSPLMEYRVAKQQLGHTVVRFLETAMAKMVWSPFDQLMAWHSVKKIAEHITQLNNSGIIEQEELEDLYHSLVAQFIQFLYLSGADLLAQTVDTIKKEIEEDSLFFLISQEQEDALESKKEKLLYAIEQLYPKIISKQYGIVT